MRASFVSISRTNRDKSGIFPSSFHFFIIRHVLCGVVLYLHKSLLEIFQGCGIKTRAPTRHADYQSKHGTTNISCPSYFRTLGPILSKDFPGNSKVSDDKSSAISLRRLHMYINERISRSRDFARNLDGRDE